MLEINFDVIDPHAQNAEAIVRLSRQDLIKGGLSEIAVKDIADPDNEQHIDRQLERLEKHSDRYLGAFALDKLVAVEKANEWFAADQYPYTGRLSIERARLLRARFAGEVHIEGHPLGIFSLVVDDEIEPQQGLEVAHSLVDWAIDRAAGREIRIGVYDGDPVAPALQDKGFVSTEKQGNVLGIRNTLFARPAELDE